MEEVPHPRNRLLMNEIVLQSSIISRLLIGYFWSILDEKSNVLFCFRISFAPHFQMRETALSCHASAIENFVPLFFFMMRDILIVSNETKRALDNPRDAS